MSHEIENIGKDLQIMKKKLDEILELKKYNI